MASCDPMNFNGVTPSQFQNISERLAELGYPLESNSGTIRGPMGIVIDYEYNSTEELLFVQVVDKSFFVPCNKIQSELTKAVRDSAL